MNTEQIYYAGIGSRETPEYICSYLMRAARLLALNNFVLRSGGAEGADISFEIGAEIGKGHMEIYIPWTKFNNSKHSVTPITQEALELAKKYHPRFNHLSYAAKKLMARNGYQILGPNLDKPSSFVLCYTPNGKGGGGTGQALRIAKDRNIPIFDFGSPVNKLCPWTNMAHFLKPWINID